MSVFGKWSSKVWCLLGLLGVVACMDEYGIADLEEQSEANEKGTALSAALSEYDEAEVMVRFVAFGDVDEGDDVPFGMMPGVQIAAIKNGDISDWWATVTGGSSVANGDLSDSYIPPGVQVMSSIESISAAPAFFMNTGSRGMVETTFAFSHPAGLGYMFCVISPADKDLLAGCSSLGNIWDIIVLGDDDSFNATLYVYFSGGRAYIDSDSGRYQRFLDGTLISGESSDATANVTFVSTKYSDSGPRKRAQNQLVAVIKDDDIGDWWEKISNNGERFLFLERYGKYGIELVPEMLELPARVLTTGQNAITKVDLEPGDYLLCRVGGDLTAVFDCKYENIAPSQDYIYRLYYHMYHSKVMASGIVKELEGYIKHRFPEAEK